MGQRAMVVASVVNKFARFRAILVHQGVRVAANRVWQWGRGKFARGPGSIRGYYEQLRATDAQFDTETGMDTGGVIGLYSLTVAGPNRALGNAYQATNPEQFKSAMSLVDIALFDATFVDLGSGKGRALLLAANYPFKRIVGVEFAEELHLAAVRNVSQLNGEDRIQIVHGDASEYALPSGPSVLYLFNPFDRPLMCLVAKTAFANWLSDPRPMRVIYGAPFLADCWLSEGWRTLTADPNFTIFAPPI